MTLRILADENIPRVTEAFSGFGDVTTAPGRAIGAEHVAGADVLLVRSVTRVNAALLEGSPVRFVGTATIGTDHIDPRYLDAAQIPFISCPGSNAESVACTITCALLELAHHQDVTLADRTLGVVGVGNVGRRVAAKGRALGMTVLLNDPPRADTEGHEAFTSLHDTLAAADFLTLHTPLTTAGPHPTHRLFDAAMIERAKPGAVILNAGRGDVIVEEALKAALLRGHIKAAALDVWENEPRIDPETLAQVQIATPHIAGYAIDGKLRGTTMLARGLACFLGAPNAWDPEPYLAPYNPPPIQLGPHGTPQEALRLVCRATYDIMGDDARLRRALREAAPEQRGAAFDHLRKTYPPRREFERHTVHIPSNTAPETREALTRLGFVVTRSPAASILT